MTATTLVVTCSGPHVDPVVLYTATYPAGTTVPESPRILCGRCGDVYRQAVADPDHPMGAGDVPTAAVVSEIGATLPGWTSENYHPA